MTTPVRIPADVERGDKLLGPFTARQVAVLAVTALVLYAAWNLTRTVITPPVFLVGAGVIVTLVTVAVLTRRDGLSADQLAWAALGHRFRPRHLVHDGADRIPAAPRWVTARAARGQPRPPDPTPMSSAALRLPQAVTAAGGGIGAVDLGADGLAVIAAASTVNLSLRTATEQDSLVAQLSGWLHTLRQPVQILIRSARLDITGHLARLDTATADMSPDLAEAAHDHAEHLAGLAASENLIHHQVLLVWREPTTTPTTTGGLSPTATLSSLLPGRRRARVRLSAAARRAAESRLLRRLGEASDLLAPFGVSVNPLDPEQANAVLAACTNPGSLVPATAETADRDAIITTDTTQYPDPDFADLPATPAAGIVPESLSIGTRHLQIGSDWVATLAVTGYPREVTAGWLAPLLSHPGRVDIAVHVDPIDPVTAATRLKHQFARLESSRRHDTTHGRPADPQVEVAVEDAAELAARVARAEARLYRVGIYLTVHADSEDELADEVAAVRALAASLLMDTCTLAYRATQAWTSTLPIGLDPIAMRRTFDTPALAAAFPFDSPQLPVTDPIAASRPRGVLYGRDAAGGLAFVDRFSPEAHNHNMVVLGRSGAGKSYLIKTEILRSLYRGIEQIVIDPEDEYRPLAQAVGGVHIPLGAPGVRLNPFDLDIHTHPDGRRTAPHDALNRRKLFLHTLIRVIAGDLTPAQRAVLDNALTAGYAAAGITPDPATWTQPAPTLSMLAEQLTHMDTPAADELAAALHPYVGEGTHAGLLDGPTTLDPDGPMIVYSLRQVPDELRTIATLLVLAATWRRVSDPATRRPRMVTVDEAWLLMREPAGAEFLYRAAKSFRKHWTGLTTATQDCADMLATDLGRAIVANAATQVLLRQAVSASDEIATAFQLSDGEKQFLLTAAQGSGLLALGSTDRAVFASLASPAEHALIEGPEFDPVDTFDDTGTDVDIDLPTLPPRRPLTEPAADEEDPNLDTASDIGQDVFLEEQNTT